MSNQGLPPSDEKVALVNEFKRDEERLLRKIDALGSQGPGEPFAVQHDPRWAAIARTHIQEGFMALNRAVFQPKRLEGDLE